MKKLLLIILLFPICSFQLNATWQNTQKHVVKKGETLYSIARTYHLSLSEIARANSISARTGVRIGQKLIIPGLKNANAHSSLSASKFKPLAVPSTPDTPYREEDIRPRAVFVSTDENLPIAEVNNTTIEKPKEEIAAVKPVAEGLRTSSSNAQEYPAIFQGYASNGYSIKRNRGAANYLADASSGNQHLAFYSEAENGSVIRVTNLMNRKTIFVKVIGKVPPNDASKEIVLKLSNKAARDLGALDEKFLVEVTSYMAN